MEWVMILNFRDLTSRFFGSFDTNLKLNIAQNQIWSPINGNFKKKFSVPNLSLTTQSLKSLNNQRLAKFLPLFSNIS